MPKKPKLNLWKKIEAAMQVKEIHDITTLAKKTGFSKQTLYNLRAGGNTTLKTLGKIAEVLDVKLTYLLG